MFYYELLRKMRDKLLESIPNCKSEYAIFLNNYNLQQINIILSIHEQQKKEKEMKKNFFLTLEQAKALRALLEEKLIEIELAKNDKFIEKSFYTELNRYLNQRITDIEKV